MLNRTHLACLLLTLVAPLRGAKLGANHQYAEPSVLDGQQSTLLDHTYHPIIRKATVEDIPAITDILVDAWAPSATHKYVFQFLDQYPKYHWKCTELDVKNLFAQLSDDEDIIINVIHAPGESCDAQDDNDCVNGARKPRAVSMAVWDLRSQKGRPDIVNDLSSPPLYATNYFDASTTTMKMNCSEHRDLNFTRARHWLDEMAAYKTRYINNAYEDQVYLRALGTHPDFDGLGYGAAQCEWGKTLARQKGWNVTLIATPPGYELYRTIGFKEIANLTFTTVEETFLTWFEAMVYEVL